MDPIGFWLGVGGFVLGLISAWPHLIALFRRARSYSSERNEARRKELQRHLHYLVTSPSYFVATVTRQAFGTILLVFVYYVLVKASAENISAEAAFVVSVGRGLVAFSIGAIGAKPFTTSWQVMRAIRQRDDTNAS